MYPKKFLINEKSGIFLKFSNLLRALAGLISTLFASNKLKLSYAKSHARRKDFKFSRS